jgi:serine/threonine protein kinase
MERYTFVEKLAEGAYGTVWKCVDKETGKEQPLTQALLPLGCL